MIKKSSLLLTFLFAFFVNGCGARSTAVSHPALSLQSFPNFQFYDLKEKKQKKLADYRGQIVMLHFWATWCVPCLHEQQILENVHTALGDEEFEVMSIAIDDSLPRLKKFFEETRQSFSFGVDTTGEAKERYQVSSLPLTVFVGKNGESLQIKDPLTGEVVTRVNGSREWDTKQGSASLRALLK